MELIGVFIIIILILLLLLMRDRSMLVQRFAVLEFVLILIVSAGYFFVDWKLSAMETGEYLSYQEKNFEQVCEFTDQLDALTFSGEESEDAESGEWKKEQNDAVAIKDLDDKNGASAGWETELKNAVDRAVSAGKKEEETAYQNIAILEKTGDGYERVYFSGEDTSFAQSADFQEKLYPTVKKAFLSQEPEAALYRESSVVLFLADTNSNVPRRVLCVETGAFGLTAQIKENQTTFLYVALVIAALGSALALMVAFFQDLEWKQLVKAISIASSGKNEWKRPNVRSSEMQTLWNSFGELVKSIARTNYDKYRMFQAYYRFAPKQIERILNKSSVIDVVNGDMADIEGTLVLVALSGDTSLGKKEYAGGLGRKYEILLQHQKKEGGIAISADYDLRSQKYMFLDQEEAAVRFGVESLQAFEAEGVFEKEKVLLMMHHAKFTYGILGDEEQAASYILSDDLDVLKSYRNQLSEAGVRMVVTDSMIHKISGQFTSRYIGYIEKNKSVFKLYEILDVYSEKDRRIRVDADKKFQRALELYYQDDFYLARNVFTDVLKECPEDGLAKWYIFACEHHLNHPEMENNSYGLFDCNINWQ